MKKPYTEIVLTVAKTPIDNRELDYTPVRLVERKSSEHGYRWTLQPGSIDVPNADVVLMIARTNNRTALDAPSALIHNDMFYQTSGTIFHGLEIHYTNVKPDTGYIIVETDKGTPLDSIERIE
ncbi:MAG: hypothetical protein ACXADB_14835 [Candidatus Hermodarchaeia archaeon]|jgi:hypothetical protein